MKKRKREDEQEEEKKKIKKEIPNEWDFNNEEHLKHLKYLKEKFLKKS
jgi:hypothetical protein